MESQQPELAIKGYPNKPVDPVLQPAWAVAYRERFRTRSYDRADEPRRKTIVQWCIANAHIFNAQLLKKWEDELRLFMNITHEIDAKRPREWLNFNGSWVKEWIAFRKREEENPTGTEPRCGQDRRAQTMHNAFSGEGVYLLRYSTASRFRTPSN